jgi:hypothetical protein
MIYNKDANFPYPILNNESKSYKNSFFKLDVDLKEYHENYIFVLEYNISSFFIIDLLKDSKANLYLVIVSQDSKFIRLDPQKIKETKFSNEVSIPKNRIYLDQILKVQLIIKANQDIYFNSNNNLSNFYKKYKNDIKVQKNNLIAYSETLTLSSFGKGSFDLFEKRCDSNLKSEIKIDIENEFIIINFKKESYQLRNLVGNEVLNYPYIYMGLQKALIKFLNDKGKDEVVDIDNIDELNLSPLENKLFLLMKIKKVSELTFDNIDEVIYSISDKMIEKYTKELERLSSED